VACDRRTTSRPLGVQLSFPLTCRSITVATASGASCSQKRSTVQPWEARRSLVSASLARFRATLSAQNVEFVRDTVWWSGQPCQKQPSMKTATRGPRNSRSARRLRDLSRGESTKYRKPRACTSRRTRNSGPVSLLRLPFMLLRTTSLDAQDSVAMLLPCSPVTGPRSAGPCVEDGERETDPSRPARRNEIERKLTTPGLHSENGKK